MRCWAAALQAMWDDSGRATFVRKRFIRAGGTQKRLVRARAARTKLVWAGVAPRAVEACPARGRVDSVL